MSQKDRSERFIKDTASFSSLKSTLSSQQRSSPTSSSSGGSGSGNSTFRFATAPIKSQHRYGNSKPHIRKAFSPIVAPRSQPNSPATTSPSSLSASTKRISIDLDKPDSPSARLSSFAPEALRKRRSLGRSTRYVRDNREHGMVQLTLESVQEEFPPKRHNAKHTLLLKVSGHHKNWSLEILNKSNDYMVEDLYLRQIEVIQLNFELAACIIEYLSSTSSVKRMLLKFPKAAIDEMGAITEVLGFAINDDSKIVKLSETEFRNKCDIAGFHLPEKSSLSNASSSSFSSPIIDLDDPLGKPTPIPSSSFYGSTDRREGLKGMGLDLADHSSHGDEFTDSRSSGSPRAKTLSKAVRTSSRLESMKKPSTMPADLEKFGTEPLVYTFDDKKSIDITVNDFKRLDDGEFLNDTLINFFTKLSLQEAKQRVQEETYLFNSYFFERYTSAGGGFNSVKKWTSKVNIFEKKFVVVPINARLHWYLIIICNLPELVKRSLESDALEEVGFQRKVQDLVGRTPDAIIIERQTRSGITRAAAPPIMRSTRSHGPLDSGQPVILILDSIRANSHGQDVRRLREYLIAEAKDKLNVKIDKLAIHGRTILVPQQPNYCDCGVYLIHYMERFVRGPNEFLTTVDCSSTEKNEERLTKFWQAEKLEDKREHLRNIIIEHKKAAATAPGSPSRLKNEPLSEGSDSEAFEEVEAVIENKPEHEGSQSPSEGGTKEKETSASEHASKSQEGDTALAGTGGGGAGEDQSMSDFADDERQDARKPPTEVGEATGSAGGSQAETPILPSDTPTSIEMVDTPMKPDSTGEVLQESPKVGPADSSKSESEMENNTAAISIVESPENVQI